MTEKRFKLTHLNHIDIKGLENLLNDLNDELEKVKKENEELKSFKDKVFNLLDKKLEEYPYLTLTEKWDNNCKYKHSCRENHEKNVAYASVNTTLNKLKEELSQE